jgi:hypothetical protein
MSASEIPTWDMVVESDQIYFAKTKRWYEITQTVLSLDGTTVSIYVKGQERPAQRPAKGRPDDHRRGATGRAVDLFQVIFSGTFNPGARPAPAESESENEE